MRKRRMDPHLSSEMQAAGDIPTQPFGINLTARRIINFPREEQRERTTRSNADFALVVSWGPIERLASGPVLKNQVDLLGGKLEAAEALRRRVRSMYCVPAAGGRRGERMEILMDWFATA